MTAATTSASGDVLGSTSGEVADRLRLAMARLGRRLVHAHPDAGMTPSRLTALGALEAAGPLRIGGLADILGTSAPNDLTARGGPVRAWPRHPHARSGRSPGDPDRGLILQP